MTTLVVSDLAVGYGSHQVLTAVDLTARSAELTAVLGPSGCGKTTLLRCVAGFLVPSSGQLRLGDRVLAGAGAGVPTERRRIGLVPQDGALFPHLSVGQNVAFGLRALGRRERVTRVEEMLEVVGLQGAARCPPNQLSGGEQQRVALARALAPRPDLLLLDEPFAALDARLRGEVRAQVRRILSVEQVTAVLVTHDQTEALSIADSVAVMREGRIVQQAPPEQLYDAPADVWVGTFVGEAVVLPGRCADGMVHHALGSGPAAGSSTGACTVLLRPEELVWRTDGGGRPGVVSSVAYYGHDAVITVALLAGPVVAVRTARRSLPATGETITVTVDGRLRCYPARETMAGTQDEASLGAGQPSGGQSPDGIECR